MICSLIPFLRSPLNKCSGPQSLETLDVVKIARIARDESSETARDKVGH